jgi:hypothetical protein
LQILNLQQFSLYPLSKCELEQFIKTSEGIKMKPKKKVLLIVVFLSIFILFGFGCSGENNKNGVKVCGATDGEISCLRFNNQTPDDPDDDFYVIAAHIEDPGYTIQSASIVGLYGATDLTYNLYPNDFPGWWWSDPNIFLDSPPIFPQTWIMTVICDDQTIHVIDVELTNWRWAV